jgi:tetratricopeptide (TPR) repeat protein
LTGYVEAVRADEAALHFVEALCRKVPDNPANWFALAARLEALGKIEAAATSATIGLDKKPNEAMKDRWDFLTGHANALRVIGRAQFLGRIDGTPR